MKTRINKLPAPVAIEPREPVFEAVPAHRVPVPSKSPVQARFLNNLRDALDMAKPEEWIKVDVTGVYPASTIRARSLPSILQARLGAAGLKGVQVRVDHNRDAVIYVTSERA